MVTDAFSVHAVPISPASTVLLLDDRPDLEVLMVKRTQRLAFAPAAWVFPGGRVDETDRHPLLMEACCGLTDEAASQRLGVPDGGLAWWVAAVRETLEEAGVLLGEWSGGNPHELAHRLRTRPDGFAQLVEDHRIRIHCQTVHEVARFVTPLGPPRRFDARFFVARMPEGQEETHDDGEVVDTRWVRPQVALDLHERGHFAMISPTVRMLTTLARFDAVEDVLTVAAQARPYRTVRVQDPRGAYRVLLPGDQGYDDADETVEKGHVRLYV